MVQCKPTHATARCQLRGQGMQAARCQLPGTCGWGGRRGGMLPGGPRRGAGIQGQDQAGAAGDDQGDGGLDGPGADSL